jgi:hypothetical protein
MIAYNSTDIKYDYFFQVGDDIILETPNWSKIFIEKLSLHNDIGVVGPCNLSNYNGRMLEGKTYVIENSFVSRKHNISILINESQEIIFLYMNHKK